MLIFLGCILIVIGFVAAWLEKSKYLIPYAGRFGYPINGVAVVIMGAFLSVSGIYVYSVPLAVLFLVGILLIWIIMEVIIKRMARKRKTFLSGKKGKAVTDFMLNNNGIAYGRISIEGKTYHAYISRDSRYETDVMPEFIPGQEQAVSEAQRNLDTIAEMQVNPCIAQKGVALFVIEVDSMTPRVAMIK
jgi:membrane protein implicated in regulation of membrane protease activity